MKTQSHALHESGIGPPTPHRSRAGSYQGSSGRVGDWTDGGP